MGNKRIAYFDFLRGIAIIMVVGIHTFPLSHSDELIYVMIRQILNCAVPLFLAISGFFIAKKDLSTPQSRKAFRRKQIPAVYIPCLVFSTGWFFLEVYGSKFENLHINLFNLLLCGFSVYYFIAVIIQCYLLAPILLKDRFLTRGGVFVTGIISAISVTAVSYILYVEQIRLDLIFYAGPCVLWIFFFMLGIYLSSHRNKVSLSAATVLMITGFVASVVETYYFKTYHNGGLGIKLSSFMFSAGAVLVMFSPQLEKRYATNYLTQLILRIGEMSFGIYFLHMYVKLVLVYMKLSHGWFLDWFLLITISSGIIFISKLVFPKKINRTLFGFR